MTAKDDGGKEAVGGGKGRLFTVGLVTSWYSSNIRVLLLYKYLLSNYGFKYPIFLTMCHMAACSVLSYAAIAWLRLVPMQLVRSRTQLAKIAALSLVFCASVVSGNISLRFLPVSFNQAIGATTPFFTAVFASSSPSSASPGPPTSPSSQSSPASSSLAGYQRGSHPSLTASLVSLISQTALLVIERFRNSMSKDHETDSRNDLRSSKYNFEFSLIVNAKDELSASYKQ